MGLVTGALPLQRGSISVHAQNPLVGYVPQELHMDPSLACGQFLDYCAWLKKLPRRQWAAERRRVLSQVGLEGREHCKVGALSGGMRRRLGLSQALLGSPDWVVLDEPTNALDPAQRRALLTLLRRMVGEDVGMLVSTHLVEDAARLADDLVIVSQGRVAWQGTAAELGPDAAARSARLESLFLSVVGSEDGDADGRA